MGIRPGSLYVAFGDKKSLFQEVVRSYGRSPVGAFVGVALAEETTAYDAFARILREAAAIYPDPSHPAGCLTISAATNVTPRTPRSPRTCATCATKTWPPSKPAYGQRGRPASYPLAPTPARWPPTSPRSSRACRSAPATEPRPPS
ncbi:hypothetical protein Pflav_028790 [Phytohabitans flavus]|uniref:HTH tetR-type domain-containing protein n=1 Tax=Phytohabitans flavus TaxID=1076124 RepID=A0A6F8XRQ8_9ACTN|nr:TetR/AcrR family transcriptional regulator [Phytohabitans flavus]BCB76469.1 hypothetical protein Pflav_028790 [Phytohabitans flavus]